MKNIHKIHILTLLLIVTLLVQCKDEPVTPPKPKKEEPNYDSLPPITSEGKNTFGCKVDGKVWIPRVKGHSSQLVPVQISYSSVSKSFHAGCLLWSGDTLSQALVIDLGKGQCKGIGKNYISCDANSTYAYFSDGKREYYNCKQVGIKDTTSYITFTRLDTQNPFIYSGIFDLTLYSYDNVKQEWLSIRITDGRFDVK
jgi:hypothetical protein